MSYKFNPFTGTFDEVGASTIAANQVTYDNTDSGLAADNVQDAVDEVQGNVETVDTSLSNHISDPTDAHDASAISYNNASSGLTATNVQAAVDEIDNIIDTLPNPIYYAGTWDASTNTPTLSDADVGREGALYRVNVGGTIDLGSGPVTYDEGDSIVNNGTIWDKWDHSDQVLAVNGQTGAVQLNAIDIPFDNTNTDIVATNVQGAIDEQFYKLYDHTVLPSAHLAENLDYDNSTSGLTATNVQTAIDEVLSVSAAVFADKSLSNLTTTSINEDLIPDGDQNRVLGQSGRMWASTFTGDIRDTINEVGVDVTNRQLLNSSSVPMLDFAGTTLDALTHTIENVVDPVNPQDAATMNYVDTAISAIPAGANQTLSNLTSPTSINQDLIPDADNTRNLGTFNTGYDGIFVGFLRKRNGEAIVDTSGHNLYDAFGNPIISFAVSVNVNNNKIINLTDPTDPQDAATKAYVDTGLSGKQATGNYITSLTGDVTASGPGAAAATLATVNATVGSFTNANITVNAKGLITAASNGTAGANTTLSNLTSPTAINQNLLPSAHNLREIGSPLNAFATTSSVAFAVSNGSASSVARFLSGVTAPSGTTIAAAIDTPSSTNLPIAIFTGTKAGATATNNLLLETGNQIGSGNSGSIVLQTGTAVGTRGKIAIKDGSEGTIGHVWTSSTTTGEGSWQPTASVSSTTFNKETFTLSGTDITNQYIDLAHVAKTFSIHFIVKDGAPTTEGVAHDYSVNYTGGSGGNTRITFLNDLATGGPAALIATDIIQIAYAY